jgi:hypothetical protein
VIRRKPIGFYLDAVRQAEARILPDRVFRLTPGQLEVRLVDVEVARRVERLPFRGIVADVFERGFDRALQLERRVGQLALIERAQPLVLAENPPAVEAGDQQQANEEAPGRHEGTGHLSSANTLTTRAEPEAGLRVTCRQPSS